MSREDGLLKEQVEQMAKGARRRKAKRVEGSVVRVNMGGGEYTDRTGRVWQEDKGYHKGSLGCMNLPETDVFSTSDRISGSDDPSLFRTGRVGEEIIYRFDLPKGKYRVRILFAEVYWESGDAEQEDVFIQGKRVLSGFNIFDEAGHDAAIEKSFSAGVTKGFLEVRFVGVSLPMHSGARACAIEVEPIKTQQRGGS